MEDPRAALGRLAVGVVRCAHDDIGTAIAVHVARRRHRVAEPRAGLVALLAPDVGRRQSGRLPQEEESPALVDLPAVKPVRADDDIRVAVPVHIARRAHREAIVGISHRPRHGPVVAGGQPRGACGIRDWSNLRRLDQSGVHLNRIDRVRVIHLIDERAVLHRQPHVQRAARGVVGGRRPKEKHDPLRVGEGDADGRGHVVARRRKPAAPH